MTFPSEIPPFIDAEGRPIPRGSKAWDARELAREKAGCRLLSYGDMDVSIATNGQSSKARLTHGNIEKARRQQLP